MIYIFHKFSDWIFSVYEVKKYYIEAALFSVRVIKITDSVDS